LGYHEETFQSRGCYVGNDFGNWTTGSISGVKFRDLDRDGQPREAGEPGLPGWTIYVDYDNDNVRDPGEPFAVTDANGNYTITGINPGAWRLREELPVNWVNTYPTLADSYGRYWQVVVQSSGSSVGRDFGNVATPALWGRKYYDANRNGANDSEPGLAGWTIQLYQDSGNGTFEPNIYVPGKGPGAYSNYLPVGGVGGYLVTTGADGDPLYTAVTDASGNYGLGTLVGGLTVGQTYFVREVRQQGWSQTNTVTTTANWTPATNDDGTVTVYRFTWNGSAISGVDFGNASCTDKLFVGAGTVAAYPSDAYGLPYLKPKSAGILTIQLVGSGTFTVARSDSTAFRRYDPATATLLAPNTSAPSQDYAAITGQSYLGGQRVDILVTAADVTAGVSYVVTVSGASGSSTLRAVNAVNIDTATLDLQITGTKCGDFIGVFDDPNIGGTLPDAKRVLFGALTGSFTTAGGQLGFQGVQYNTPILNAMFGGNPTISRIDINSLEGDDIVRVGDELTQQLVVYAGAGNDLVRAGAGKATVSGDAGHDVIFGGAGDDVLSGVTGDDLIFGAGGADRLYGGDGSDWLAGGDGDDPTIKGDAGNDMLSGGLGKDRLYGDAGTDTGYYDSSDLTLYLIENYVNVTADRTLDAVERRLLAARDYLFTTNIDELMDDLVPPPRPS
jgi:hypothetical protein